MLEIIALVLLCKHNAKLVKEKGAKPWVYVLITIFLWIGFELIGALVGQILVGEGLQSYLFALLGAGIGAFISYSIAKNIKPEAPDMKDVLDAEI